MTTEVQARDAIVAYFHPAWTTAYPSVPVYYENTVKIDLDTVGNAFLSVSIDFNDSVREGIDSSPITGSYGEVTFRLFAKDGVGVRDTLARQNYIRELMKYRDLSGVALDCPRPGRKQAKDGWASSDLIVPLQFWQ